MMSRMVWRQLMAHRVRSLLTVGSIAVAVFLLCLLRATLASLTEQINTSSTRRLWVQSAVSLFVDLPIGYENKIQAVRGVDRACKFQWFAGMFRGERVSWAQFGIDPDDFAVSYPEVQVVKGSYDAFAADRTGCIIGEDLAAEYGWGLGDRVALGGTIFPRADGGAWEFTVQAMYRSKTTNLDNRTLFFDFDYLRQSLEQGAAYGADGVGCYVLAIAEDAEPGRVMADVDALFENGPQRVQTTTEAEFQRQFASMLGSVPTLLAAIGGAVLFAIFFAVLNTMLMAGRERVREAGVLSALGFPSGTIVWLLLAESVLLCALGALSGIGLILLLEDGLQQQLAGFLAEFSVPVGTMVLGAGLALAVGVVSGLVPGLGLRRLKPVDALRRVA